MESEEDIQKKFDRFYTEALTSPLPKLKFHRPVKKLISLQNTKSPKVTPSSKTSKPKEEKAIHDNQSAEKSVTEVQQPTPVQQISKNTSHSDTTNKDKERSDLIEGPQQLPSATLQQEDPEDDAADDDDLYPPSSGQVTHSCEDDEHEVSSIVDEEEEFFLHKPRPTRNKVHTKDRRLNLDKLWSRIIIHKTPATRKDYSNGSYQHCLLRRNLKQGKCFFMEYLAQMKLLQENEDVKTKTRRGQKRKSASEVELSKVSKVKKPMRQSRENTNKEAQSNRTSKPKQGGQSRKGQNWTVTPKDSELKKPIRRTRQNAISQKPLAQKTLKKLSSESTRRSSTQDQDGVIFIDIDETESEARLKKTKLTSKSNQKSLTTCAPTPDRKSNNVDKISKGVPKTTPARQAQKARPGKSHVTGQSKTNNDAAVDSEVEPLSRLTDAAGAIQRSPTSTGVAVDLPSVAMDDPLVAASMTEDWGVGIRPLFSSRGRRTHCGGVWKAIIDET